MGRFQSEEAAAALLKHLHGDAADAAQEALARMGKHALLAIGVALEQDQLNPRQKVGAAKALGAIGEREAIPLLEKLGQDKDPNARAEAERSLSLIRGF